MPPIPFKVLQFFTENNPRDLASTVLVRTFKHFNFSDTEIFESTKNHENKLKNFEIT